MHKHRDKGTLGVMSRGGGWVRDVVKGACRNRWQEWYREVRVVVGVGVVVGVSGQLG